MQKQGKLILIPTPIGNLEDITLRAIRMLSEADVVLAEDTRVSGKLLQHLKISKPLWSYHAHNEHKQLNILIQELLQGKTLALVSDAGTPGISDPGFLLVREALQNEISVEVLPGPTAFVPALVKSGLPCDTFVYLGFLPEKKGRQTAIKQLAEENKTTVLYESPHRLLKTLEQFKEFLGAERRISVSRELTKLFEETINGTVEEVLIHFQTHPIKGEFVIVVEGKK